MNEPISFDAAGGRGRGFGAAGGLASGSGRLEVALFAALALSLGMMCILMLGTPESAAASGAIAARKSDLQRPARAFALVCNPAGWPHAPQSCLNGAAGRAPVRTITITRTVEPGLSVATRQPVAQDLRLAAR